MRLENKNFPPQANMNGYYEKKLECKRKTKLNKNSTFETVFSLLDSASMFLFALFFQTNFHYQVIHFL